MEVSLFQPATSFTFLEYMIIWCKIKVIINPLLHPFLWVSHNFITLRLEKINKFTFFLFINEEKILKMLKIIWLRFDVFNKINSFIFQRFKRIKIIMISFYDSTAVNFMTAEIGFRSFFKFEESANLNSKCIVETKKF